MSSVPLDIRQKHNKLLVDLSDLIHIEGQCYKNFIGFLHNAALPAGRLQRVKDEPMEVFHLMEERGILKEGDYSALEEALDASCYKQALDLVKKIGSEITKQIEGQRSTSIAIQETSAAGDDSPSNKKRKIDDNDSHMDETDTTATSQVVTPTAQPTSITECTPQTLQVVAPTQQPSMTQCTPQIIPTQPAFAESQGQAGKSDDLQDEVEILEAIKSNVEKIEDMIRKRWIPKQSIMLAAVKQYGYSKSVQMTLHEMSKLLKREIPEAVGVWCGYKPDEPHTPVFVVTLKSQKGILQKAAIPELFIDYSIIIQYKHVPNDEERSVTEQYGNKSVRSEDVARLNNSIAKHTESLMTEHSNLSIIRACPVKSRGYLRNQMDVIEKPCIVFYVPVKGIIPVGEKEFPTEIDGIATDVREGEFYFFGSHNAMEYHQKLRMGCCITGSLTGSLGGFIDLPGEKVGCITAAHVVLGNKQIQQYINLGEEEKRQLNDDLAQGKKQIDIYQPTPEPGLKPFGRVQAIALDAGHIFSPSVDAAIIEISDEERKPEVGNFPDGDFENVGFTKEEPMLYTSGNILNDIDFHQRGCLVIKFGCTTGITRGCMEWIGESVRPVDIWGSYSFPFMVGQLEVKSYNFAVEGDSGALVFCCAGGNVRNLRAVGMIIGGSSTGCQCFFTPIKAVFEKLGLRNNRFKVFPSRQLSQQETVPKPLTEDMTEHLRMVEQNMNRSMNESLMRVEQKLNENMNKRFMRVEQNINENMNEHIRKVEQNMNENMNECLTRAEQNMNENMNLGFNRMEDLLNNLNGKS